MIFFWGEISLLSQEKKVVIVKTKSDFLTNRLSNTKYEIRSVINLDESEIPLPPNSEVVISAGSIINGEIKGNNTILTVLTSSCLGVKLSGTWFAPTIDDSFFIPAILSDDDIFFNINNLQNDKILNTIYLKKNKYNISIKESGGYALKLKDKVNIVNKSTISLLGNNYKGYSILLVSKSSDIDIAGGKIVGDVGKHKYQSGTSSEWGMGITIEASENVTIHDISISRCTGDGIYISGLSTDYIGDYSKSSKNIVLRNVISDTNRRQGLSVISVDGLLVENCSFINTGKVEKTAPSSGIDIEPNVSKGRNNSVRNIMIKNCRLIGNMGRSFEADLSVSDGIIVNFENIVVDGCYADGQFLIGTPCLRVNNSRIESVLIRPYEAPVDILFANCKIEGRGVIINDYHKHNPLYTNRNTSKKDVDLTLNNCIIKYKSQPMISASSIISILSNPETNVFVSFDSCDISTDGQYVNTNLISNDNKKKVMFRGCIVRVPKYKRYLLDAVFANCSWEP